MSKYNCDCCNFHTDIKTKYEDHKKTNKHLSKLNIMTADKDKIIEGLQLEVSYLRGKVEAFELMFKKGVENTVLGPVKVEHEEQGTYDEPTELVNFDNGDAFWETLQFDVNEALAEEIAGLRTDDDANYKLTECMDAYEAFINNPKNNLPYIQVFRDSFSDNNAILDFICEKVLKDTSMKITDKYRGLFHIYQRDEWLGVQESSDIIATIITSFVRHLRKYFKCLKIYYSYDSNTKQLCPEREKDIQFTINKLIKESGLNERDEEEDLKYILKKFR